MQSAQSKLEVFVPNGELTDVLEVVHVLRSGAAEDTTLAGRRVSERTDHLSIHHGEAHSEGDDDS